MLKTYSISTKIAIIFIIVIAMLIISSGTALYFLFNNIMQEQVVQDLNQVMLQNKLNCDNLVNSVDNATMLLYKLLK